MKNSQCIIAAVAVGTLTVAACGDDDGGSSGDNDVLIDAMVSEGASQAEAECFVDRLGDDAERLFAANDDDSLSEDDMERARDALTECSDE